MDSLPPALLDFISIFRPLLRAEVFESFTYLLCGLLIGEAKHGTVRASVFAPAAYQPQRLSDLSGAKPVEPTDFVGDISITLSRTHVI